MHVRDIEKKEYRKKNFLSNKKIFPFQNFKHTDK